MRDLDRRLGGDAVLASNTSGFSIAALGAATDHPDRVVGWHWASPAPVMRFAEIVRRARDVVGGGRHRLRSRPEVQQEPDRRERRRDRVGFVANRHLFRSRHRGAARRRRGDRRSGRCRSAHGRLLQIGRRARSGWCVALPRGGSSDMNVGIHLDLRNPPAWRQDPARVFGSHSRCARKRSAWVRTRSGSRSTTCSRTATSPSRSRSLPPSRRVRPVSASAPRCCWHRFAPRCRSPRKRPSSTS